MNKIPFVLLPLSLVITACGPKAQDNTDQPMGNAALPMVAPVSPGPTPTAAATPMPAGFSIDTVPLSNSPLGKFPFFGLPTGYKPQNPPKSVEFGHFLFWNGKAFENVEGQVYMTRIINQEEKNFSSYALRRNLETLFQQAGATKITESRIPLVALEALPDGTRQELTMGLGDVWNDPVQTWVIRRPHDAVWIHYTTNTSEGALAVVQTKPFVVTATLLPANQLKSDLDKTGKAVIHVNFATDRTAILPSSTQQMDAVIALLEADATLKLAINGYTDDTGSDAHNVTLSDGRAKAVHAALVAAGIAPGRLQAKGYGRLNPVSANANDTGKAANRRVELVKL